MPWEFWSVHFYINPCISEVQVLKGSQILITLSLMVKMVSELKTMSPNRAHIFPPRRNEHSPVWHIFDTTFKHFRWWPVHLVRIIPSLEFLPRHCDGIAQNRFDLLCRRRSQGANSIVQNARDMNSWQKKTSFHYPPRHQPARLPINFQVLCRFFGRIKKPIGGITTSTENGPTLPKRWDVI